MNNKNRTMFASILLASCINSVAITHPAAAPAKPEEQKVLEMSVDNHKKIFLEEELIPSCPAGMATIDDLYYIDLYEASVVDKSTDEYASPHYIPSQDGAYDADWQYQNFKDKIIPPDKLQQLIKENQPISLPLRGAEQFSSFEPAAVSQPDKIPASYITKIVAEQACINVGKRLCTRKEWYKACVGPDGPSPQLNEKGEEVFPEAYPYGLHYERGKCNIGLQTNRWPPGLLGRKNNQEMLDPRIGALLGTDGLPMKQRTDSFSGCTNGYGVYNMLGNVHEIVSDIRIAVRFPKERVTFVGSHYARSASESCAEATTDHWEHYTDYSIGFRCCKGIN